MNKERDPALPGKLMGVAVGRTMESARAREQSSRWAVQWSIVISAMLVLLGLIIGGVL